MVITKSIAGNGYSMRKEKFGRLGSIYLSRNIKKLILLEIKKLHQLILMECKLPMSYYSRITISTWSAPFTKSGPTRCTTSWTSYNSFISCNNKKRNQQMIKKMMKFKQRSDKRHSSNHPAMVCSVFLFLWVVHIWRHAILDNFRPKRSMSTTSMFSEWTVVESSFSFNFCDLN